MDRTESLLLLTSHLLNITQCLSQHLIKDCSVAKLKDMLYFSSVFQQLVRTLDESERNSLSAFVISLQTQFPHLSLKSVTTVGLENALQIILKVLKENTHLTQSQRDCIFEFYLDETSEAIQFETLPTELFGLTNELASTLESRLVISHLVELETQDSVKVLVFLDSCYSTDPEYTFELVIRTLEQLTNTLPFRHKTLSNTLLQWLSTAVVRANSVRLLLARSNPQRLRDLALCLPGFEVCLFSLFQYPHQLQVSKDGPSLEVICRLVRCLITSLPCGPKLLTMIQTFTGLDQMSDGIWKSVWLSLSEDLPNQQKSG